LQNTDRSYEIQIHLDIVGATKGADDSEGPPAPLLNCACTAAILAIFATVKTIFFFGSWPMIAKAKAAAAAAQEAATTVVAAAATSGVVQKATASASGSVVHASHRQSVRQRRERRFFCLTLLLSQTNHTHTLQVSRLCSRTCRGHSCRETRGLRGDRHDCLDTSSGLRE
jgi:hypothetical protein